MSKEIYWMFNIPLQVQFIHKDEDDESTPVVDIQILNYAPRKEQLNWVSIEELPHDGDESAFLMKAAEQLEKLAAKMRESAVSKSNVRYTE